MAAGRKFFMATEAWAGQAHDVDIGRDKPDLCIVFRETIGDYFGQWVEGFGFFNVRFPKATTRELTPEERQRYRDRPYLSSPWGRMEIAIDEERELECVGG